MQAAPALAAHVADTDRRRANRAEVALDTLMVDREGRTFAARILNLSELGLLAETEAPLCQRAPIRVDLPTIGWLRADVVWSLGPRIGAAFREPIDANTYAAFVRLFG
ncbi:MAG: PilZ domain-containing protein [Sphingomonadaceae bacterium]|nr:PilZ domain-containing protein [Sphingomonadaceae bacterium]